MKIKQEVLNVLESCKIVDNVVFLPDAQLDRKVYVDTNKCLEGIGGKWNRKQKGHVFNSDPLESIENLLLYGEYIDIKTDFQYFPTPEKLVIKMIEMANINSDDVVLEPSAGQGAIADEIKCKQIITVELNQDNASVLRNKGYDVIQENFLEVNNLKYSKVVMNPPFSKQQDIDHVLHAYKQLDSNGILVAVMSESPFFRSNKKSVDFREFLESVEAEIITNPENTFKESGTGVNTRLVKIIKK